MKNKLENAMIFANANAQLGDVSRDISSIVSTILGAFERTQDNSVSFNREDFSMDIEIGEKKYSISVQGRGGETEKYYKAILDIISKEINPT